jgi:cysteine desulfurase
MRPEVIDSVMAVHAGSVPNPSGPHRSARRSRAILESARESVAEMLGVTPREVVFTRGGTESCNLAVLGAVRPRGLHLSAIEHAAVRSAMAKAGERAGIGVDEISVDAEGVLDLTGLEGVGGGSLVSIMAANNETGAIQPIGEIAALLRAADGSITVHSDAIAAASTQDLAEVVSHCDLVSIAGHKLGGPPGVGVLVVRAGTPLEAMHLGGGQEAERRAGTEDVAGAVGFARALELAAEDRRVGRVDELRRLRDVLEEDLTGEVEGLEVTSRSAPRLDGHLHVTIDGVRSEELLVLLDRHGIAASAGAACASGAPQASHVLTAMGMSAERARGALRLTLSTSSTADEVRAASEAIRESVAILRRAG